jgi:hypothetical protein
MNDRDWLKKFRRHPKGGCTTALALLLGVGLGAVAWLG